MQRHTIIVSNRLPISITKQDGKLIYNPSSGGLATAMSSIGKEHPLLWIGWPGIASDDLTQAEQRQLTKDLRKDGYIPVFLTKEQIDGYYDGYANGTLWPLFHYFPHHSDWQDTDWHTYEVVNNLFAEVAIANAAPTSSIWVHDYHLMLLPAIIRTEKPESKIGFFMHIPFPSFELFRFLPHRKALLEGLLGSDLIGFHTYDYARHFLSSCLRTLGYESKHGTIDAGTRSVHVDSFPISIDYDKFESQSMSAECQKSAQEIRSHHAGRHIILSVDRLDYSKGIIERLTAFEKFLEDHPEHHARIDMILIAVPSRQDVEAYRQLRDEVEKIIGHINGTYATSDWTPISYRYQNLPFEEIVSLYVAADTALVTPLRDGMNLVAKEFIASKFDGNGTLILSEMAGASSELSEAHLVNPRDIQQIAQAINDAIDTPSDVKQQSMQIMRQRIKSYDVVRWAEDFMEQLDQADETPFGNTVQLSAEHIHSMYSSYKHANKKLLLLDYDGTLRNFVNSPEPSAAKPSAELYNTIRLLSDSPDTQICIISGRPREALTLWFGDIPSITLIAEHGAWIREQGEWAQADVSFTEEKALLLPILKRYEKRTPGAKLEEKTFALVWHYRNVQPELAYARTASLKHDLHKVIDASAVGVFQGNKILEIKPKIIHKGTVVEELLASSGADFVLCAGDDYTDEHMFGVLPDDAWSIKVGNGESIAKYRTQSPDALITILELLLKK